MKSINEKTKDYKESWNFDVDMHERPEDSEGKLFFRKVKLKKMETGEQVKYIKVTVIQKGAVKRFRRGLDFDLEANEDVVLFIGGTECLFPSYNIYLNYLKRLSKSLNATVWYLHYSEFIPNGKYPTQLNEVLLFYKSVIWYLKMRMKRKKFQNKVFLIGESFGGNLVAGLINQLILSDFPILPAKVVFISASKLGNPDPIFSIQS